MRAALTVEWWKTRRSPVVLAATALLVALVPLLGWAMLLAAGREGGGAVGAKADLLLVGEGWSAYLGAVGQIAAAAMFVGAGVVVAWMFGREHAERTFPGLFATSVSRGAVATAKLVVVVAWCVVVSAATVLVTAVLGVLGGVGPYVGAEHGPLLVRLFVVAVSTTVLTVPVGWVASVGRGYLPAVGAVVVLLAAGQVVVVLGGGTWFPFAVPGLLAAAGAPGVPAPTPTGAGLAALTVVVGAAATVHWWRHAEVA